MYNVTKSTSTVLMIVVRIAVVEPDSVVLTHGALLAGEVAVLRGMNIRDEAVGLGRGSGSSDQFVDDTARKVMSGYVTKSAGVVEVVNEVANELATNLDVVEGEVLQRGRLVVGQGGRAKPGVKVGMSSVNDPTWVPLMAMVRAVRRCGLASRRSRRVSQYGIR